MAETPFINHGVRSTKLDCTLPYLLEFIVHPPCKEMQKFVINNLQYKSFAKEKLVGTGQQFVGIDLMQCFIYTHSGRIAK